MVRSGSKTWLDYSAWTLFSEMTAVISMTSLYQAGGRYFLVPNLPPLGDKPNYRTNQKYREEANAFVMKYNPLLEAKLDQLQSLVGITIMRFDTHKLFTAVIANKSTYKLTNVPDAAFSPDYSTHGGSVGPNPDQYLFWDTTHPTRVGHEIVAESIYDVIQKTLAAALSDSNG